MMVRSIGWGAVLAFAVSCTNKEASRADESTVIETTQEGGEDGGTTSEAMPDASTDAASPDGSTTSCPPLGSSAPSWSVVPSGTSQALTGVWAASSCDAWIVGYGGVILHWNGTEWSPSPSGVTVNLTGVWGRSSTDVWVVGAGGTVLHWDGTAWSATTGITTAPNAIRGSADGKLWIGGGTEAFENRMWDSNATFLSQRDGATWTKMLSGRDLGRVTGPLDVRGALSIWPTESGGWALTGDGLASYDGATWSRQTLLFPPLQTTDTVCCRNAGFSGIWAASSSDAWVIGNIGGGVEGKPEGYYESIAFHWDGNEWQSTLVTRGRELRSIWGSSSTDIWAGAQPRPFSPSGTMVSSVFHGDGTSWTEVAAPEHRQANAIGGSASNDVWLVAPQGVILHYVP